MVIPVDTLLIKQLEKQLNDIIVISIITWQDDKGNNSIMENLSIWPISQHLPFFEECNVCWMFVVCIVQLVLGGVSVETNRTVEIVEYAF